MLQRFHYLHHKAQQFAKTLQNPTAISAGPFNTPFLFFFASYFPKGFSHKKYTVKLIGLTS